MRGDNGPSRFNNPSNRFTNPIPNRFAPNKESQELRPKMNESKINLEPGFKKP